MRAEGLHTCTFPHDMREPRTGRGSHAVADAHEGASAEVRGSGLDRSVDVLGQSGLGLLDDGLEGLGIGDGQLGEGAAVQLDAGQVQTLDEAVVGDAFGADGGVDALDPQLAEVTLASLAVAEVVGKGVQQLLLGLTVQAGALAAVAGSPLENDATLLVGVYCALDTCHI